MLVLKILEWLVIIFVVIAAASALNEKYIEKFQFAIFSKAMAIAQLITGLCFFFGKEWYIHAIKNKGDILNGQILIGLGVVIGLITIITIYQRTNFTYGTIGNVINLGSLAFFTFIGSYLFIIYVASNIFLFLTAKPVYVVNK